MNQPKQKSYDQFNTSWPMNSWEVTENSFGYQIAYIRLLSQFVATNGSLSTNKFDESIVSYRPNLFNSKIYLKSKEPFKYEIYNITGKKKFQFL